MYVLALAGFTPRSIQVVLALALAFLGSSSFFVALCEITTSAFPFPFGWLVFAMALFLLLILVLALALFQFQLLFLVRDPALVGFWRYSACISFEAFGTHEKCWQRTALGTPTTPTLASFRIVPFRFGSVLILQFFIFNCLKFLTACAFCPLHPFFHRPSVYSCFTLCIFLVRGASAASKKFFHLAGAG